MLFPLAQEEHLFPSCNLLGIFFLGRKLRSPSHSLSKVEQPVALRITGNKAAFCNCGFYGVQDTLYDHERRVTLLQDLPYSRRGWFRLQPWEVSLWGIIPFHFSTGSLKFHISVTIILLGTVSKRKKKKSSYYWC